MSSKTVSKDVSGRKDAKFDDFEVKILGEENFLKTVSDVAGRHSKVILRKIRIIYNDGTLSHDVIQVHIKDWLI